MRTINRKSRANTLTVSQYFHDVTMDGDVERNPGMSRMTQFWRHEDVNVYTKHIYGNTFVVPAGSNNPDQTYPQYTPLEEHLLSQIRADTDYEPPSYHPVVIVVPHHFEYMHDRVKVLGNYALCGDLAGQHMTPDYVFTLHSRPIDNSSRDGLFIYAWLPDTIYEDEDSVTGSVSMRVAPENFNNLPTINAPRTDATFVAAMARTFEQAFQAFANRERLAMLRPAIRRESVNVQRIITEFLDDISEAVVNRRLILESHPPVYYFVLIYDSDSIDPVFSAIRHRVRAIDYRFVQQIPEETNSDTLLAFGSEIHIRNAIPWWHMPVLVYSRSFTVLDIVQAVLRTGAMYVQSNHDLVSRVLTDMPVQSHVLAFAHSMVTMEPDTVVIGGVETRLPNYIGPMPEISTAPATGSVIFLADGYRLLLEQRFRSQVGGIRLEIERLAEETPQHTEVRLLGDDFYTQAAANIQQQQTDRAILTIVTQNFQVDFEDVDGDDEEDELDMVAHQALVAFEPPANPMPFGTQHVFDKTIFIPITCAICLCDSGDDIADGYPNGLGVQISCGHWFHFLCIHESCRQIGSCPSCRRSVMANYVPPTHDVTQDGDVEANPGPPSVFTDRGLDDDDGAYHGDTCDDQGCLQCTGGRGLGNSSHYEYHVLVPGFLIDKSLLLQMDNVLVDTDKKNYERNEGCTTFRFKRSFAVQLPERPEKGEYKTNHNRLWNGMCAKIKSYPPELIPMKEIEEAILHPIRPRWVPSPPQSATQTPQKRIQEPPKQPEPQKVAKKQWTRRGSVASAPVQLSQFKQSADDSNPFKALEARKTRSVDLITPKISTKKPSKLAAPVSKNQKEKPSKFAAPAQKDQNDQRKSRKPVPKPDTDNGFHTQLEQDVKPGQTPIPIVTMEEREDLGPKYSRYFCECLAELNKRKQRLSDETKQQQAVWESYRLPKVFEPKICKGFMDYALEQLRAHNDLHNASIGRVVKSANMDVEMEESHSEDYVRQAKTICESYVSSMPRFKEIHKGKDKPMDSKPVEVAKDLLKKFEKARKESRLLLDEMCKTVLDGDLNGKRKSMRLNQNQDKNLFGQDPEMDVFYMTLDPDNIPSSMVFGTYDPVQPVVLQSNPLPVQSVVSQSVPLPVNSQEEELNRILMHGLTSPKSNFDTLGLAPNGSQKSEFEQIEARLEALRPKSKSVSEHRLCVKETWDGDVAFEDAMNVYLRELLANNLINCLGKPASEAIMNRNMPKLQLLVGEYREKKTTIPPILYNYSRHLTPEEMIMYPEVVHYVPEGSAHSLASDSVVDRLVGCTPITSIMNISVSAMTEFGPVHLNVETTGKFAVSTVTQGDESNQRDCLKGFSERFRGLVALGLGKRLKIKLLSWAKPACNKVIDPVVRHSRGAQQHPTEVDVDILADQPDIPVEAVNRSDALIFVQWDENPEVNSITATNTIYALNRAEGLTIEQSKACVSRSIAKVRLMHAAVKRTARALATDPLHLN